MTTDTDVGLKHADLTVEQLLEIYRYMLLTREVDNRVRSLYLQGKVVGGVYSQLGHEAISVGTAYTLRSDDVIAPMHRDLGAHIVRGMEVGRFEQRLIDGGIMRSEIRDTLKVDIARDVDGAARWAEEQPLPDPAAASKGVYRSH